MILSRVNKMLSRRKWVASVAAAGLLSGIISFGVGPVEMARAVNGPNLYYAWGQGTNVVSQISGGTTTDTWASGSTGSGAATGVASDDTYIYWANGKEVFRQPIGAASGASVVKLLDWTGWYPNGLSGAGANRTIRSLAVDATHIYISGSRGYDGSTVLRASKTTGVMDATWAWAFAGSREGWGLTVDNNASGYVFAAWGNEIAKASKTPTTGAPSTVSYDWTRYNMPLGSSTNPIPLANDGTYIYFPNSFSGVLRRDMSEPDITVGTISSAPSVTAAVANTGAIHGIAYNAATGALFMASNTSASNTYTIYTVVPDVSLPTPTVYATFTTTTWAVTSLVAAPAPAVAPTIGTQPAAVTTTVGQPISLSVAATTSDSGVLSYQWKKGGVSIAGATSAQYSISSAALGDAGTYSVEVKNTLGSSTATTISSNAVVAVGPAPTTTTSTTVPASSSTSSVAASTLVTAANQTQLEAAPGEAVAVINGKEVAVETVKVQTNASASEMQNVAKEIVADIEKLLPAGVSNTITVKNTSTGAELTGLMVNPEDPKEKLNVPVESVTLVKAGDAAVLISALNQTNLPAEVTAGGEIQVTRGGLVAAQAYGLPGSEAGEIVLMSTPRLLQKFTVNSNGTYSGQVPLPKDIAFGSHTVVMATKNAKVSLGIKLVRTRMQFRIKRTIATTIFKNRAGVQKAGGKVTISASGRCRATTTKVTMASKAGGCYITVKQAAKGSYKAVFTRFTVQVVKKLVKAKKK